MAPAPDPTPAPAYSSINYDAILSSALGELSSINDLYLSSYDPNYLSSYLSDYYKSGYNPYSIPPISIPTYLYPYLSTTARTTRNAGTATATPTATATGTADATNTATPLGAQNNSPNDTKGGLSTSAKIGLGVGIPIGVLLLLGLGLFLWCAGKRKGKKAAATNFQPYTPTPNAVHAGVAYMPGQAQVQPPPQYVQSPYHAPNAGMTAYQAAGVKQDGAVPAPGVGVVEMEQEYHFARPGVVEMGPGGRG
jgi:hypothetical protein